MTTFRVTALYPDRMNIYADRGNLLFLQRRCEWRGIGFELTRSGLGDELDPQATDLIYIGGGQDRDQRDIAGDLLETKRSGIAGALDAGACLLAVCGGFQLLGNSYVVDDEEIGGLALCDFVTRREPGERLIGNIEIEVTGIDGLSAPAVLAGFENHGGRTYLGAETTPLGRVIHGHGNNGRDGTEGVCSGRLIGTYLHGPLLPKNAWLADWLIASGLAPPGAQPRALDPLDDAFELAAHECALSASRT